jgi:hypothetical protein
MLPSARITWRVNMRIPGQAEPGRVAIIRPCAPNDPHRRTRSFPVGRSPSPVVGHHALSSELSLITLYRTHRMEMISTLTDMTNAYVTFLTDARLKTSQSRYI